ncbi:hypothetical protein KBI23_05520 [bacterium]|nr:hypothetical protein [bacterium]MBP9810586.1 hypothetical protein [bacterium]
MNLIEKGADDDPVLHQLDHAPAEDVETLSRRLFGKVVQLNAQVCKGPCVSDEVLNGAFVEEATSPPVKTAEGRR